MFDDLIELADAADPMLYECDRETVLAMYVRAEEMARYGNEAKAKLTRHIAERFDEPQLLPNGLIVVPTTTDKRTAWRKNELLARLVEEFGRAVVTADGEPAVMLDLDTVRQFLDVATGRTRSWRNAGIDLDGFCAVERDVPTLQVIHSNRRS